MHSSNLCIDAKPASKAGRGKHTELASEALCKGRTHLFFARPGERSGKRQRREALARSYCEICPVQQACLEAGRAGRETGMWGGENDEERAFAGYRPRHPHLRTVIQARKDGEQHRLAANRNHASGVA